MSKEKICLHLFKIGAIKFGEFTLKSGLKSPVYIDLRVLVSYPSVLKEVAEVMVEITDRLEFDKIAGVPYAAIPIVTAVSLQSGVPAIYPRKEQKDYGTKKEIEGVYKEGEAVLVVDDLITTGESKFEAIRPLEEAGLKVKDIVVLIDREQGGKEDLEKKGYRLHAVLTLSELLKILRKNEKISEGQYEDTLDYLKYAENRGRLR